MQITTVAEVSEITKSVQCSLTFIFIELLKRANRFVKIVYFLNKKRC